ncbi:MAG TPA: glutamine--fructose-6-phosphate transaminase (isomerizing) [Gammaproteobacteria bacterium]|nr:glutamine--fructose-6-phosphate transaminase (isomerizing) [Gammaproteobacteria bacterium]
MCGIVGAIAKRDVVSTLMDGLRRLEYRGYDSAGIAVLADNGVIERQRAEGKVSALQALLLKAPMVGFTGIAHTRWATHGVPSERNAHPHIADGRVILVHNGIIENFQALREPLIAEGYSFLSETDSEVVACTIAKILKTGGDLLSAVRQTVQTLEGAYGLCIMDAKDPNRLIGARNGPPLVIGIGVGEHFLASDALALQHVTEQFMYLEDGDIAEIFRDKVNIFDKTGSLVQRKIYHRTFHSGAVDKAGYRHFMLKEIFEQPDAIREALTGRLHRGRVLESVFGTKATGIFDKVEHLQIVACGTSYHAGMIGRLWLENLAGISCHVEIASEFRYRKRVLLPNTLLICISQSGETADTLAALRSTQGENYCGVLSICNVPDSSLVRESALVFLTNAGPEIGVCSTKAFTTQLVALFLLTLVLARRRGLEREKEILLIQQLVELPDIIQGCLASAKAIQTIATLFQNKSHALFVGRGLQYPIVIEGALKLKEISYIHAEAYPAGELKHGALALVDKKMPVVVVAANDGLLEKLKSNIQEVRARGGELLIFTTKSSGIEEAPGIHVLEIPEVPELLGPIVYTVPLQLLAYYVAVLKGTDVDQPRNLAKSVTVE